MRGEEDEDGGSGGEGDGADGRAGRKGFPGREPQEKDYYDKVRGPRPVCWWGDESCPCDSAVRDES